MLASAKVNLDLDQYCRKSIGNAQFIKNTSKKMYDLYKEELIEIKDKMERRNR